MALRTVSVFLFARELNLIRVVDVCLTVSDRFPLYWLQFDRTHEKWFLFGSGPRIFEYLLPMNFASVHASVVSVTEVMSKLLCCN